MNSFAVIALALVAAASAASVPASTTLVRDATVVSPYISPYVSPVVPSTVFGSSFVPTANIKSSEVKAVPIPYTYQGVYPAGVYHGGIYGAAYGGAYPAIVPHIY